MRISKDFLARRVKEWRESRGWTQPELAERAKTSKTTISAIETGRVATDIEGLSDLADAFGTTVAALVDDGKKIIPFSEARIHIERALALYENVSKLDEDVVKKLTELELDKIASVALRPALEAIKSDNERRAKKSDKAKTKTGA